MLVSKVFFFIFGCLLATACGNSISQNADANQNQPEAKIELSLSIKRSGCYGRCPIYDLTIEPDGKVIFEGKGWTATIGKAEDKLNAEQLKQLAVEIEKADFFSFDEDYGYNSKNCPSLATDMPGVLLHIKLNGREKTVNHYHGCIEKDSSKHSDSGNLRVEKDFSERVLPQQLYKLEEKIDEIVNTKRWIGEQL